MIIEPLVNIETAHKLKILGFNDICDNCNKGNDRFITFDLVGYCNSMKDVVTRPTQTHVLRWLKDKGFFVSTTLAFLEFDKNAESTEDAEMLFFIKPEVYIIKEVKPNVYSKINIVSEELYTTQTNQSNNQALEDAINIALHIMLNNTK